VRLLTHLLLGHVRGRCHGPTLAAQHAGRVGGLCELARTGLLVVVEAETVGMLVFRACGETRE
jgi:hypothetical protein